MSFNLSVCGSFIIMVATLAIMNGCTSEHEPDAREQYFEAQNKLHNGDYLATYPLHSPDSCIIRLQAEVPAPYQPWGCMGIWYRMPRTDRDASFRLLELYEQHYPHDTVRTFAQIKRAEFYVDAAQFEEAEACLQEVEQTSRRLQRTLDLSDVYFLRGRIAMYQNEFAASRQAYFTYLELLDSQDTTFSQAHALAYHSIAVSYERAQQYGYMKEWIDKLWAGLHRQPNEDWVFRLKAQTALLAGIGHLRSQPDSSLVWAKLAEQIVQEDMKVPLPARLYYLFGRAYSELKQCDAALPYLLEAYRKRPGSQQAYGYYQYPAALGQAYFCAGKLDSATLYLQESLASPDTGNLATAHQMLGDIALRQSDYKGAWSHQKTSNELLKAKFTADRIRAAAETDARYEAQEQSKRVAVLEKEHQINQLRLLLLTLGALLLLGIGCGLYIRHRQRHKILTQSNELLQQEKQLAELKARLKEQALKQSEAELSEAKGKLEETASLIDLKNQLIRTLELRISQLDEPRDSDSTEKSLETAPFHELRILTKEDWRYFQERFTVQFPDFLKHLQSRHPTLTPAETRLILLIKIGFDTPQIAGMLGIADSSVWRSRNRLVKSLGLDSAKNLDDYIREVF